MTITKVEQCHIGKGWWPVVQPLLDEAHSRGHMVEQVKEKFGGLRFYYYTNKPDPDFAHRVVLAEAACDKTCEECGAPGRGRSTGWIKTLCDEHYAEREKRYAKH